MKLIKTILISSMLAAVLTSCGMRNNNTASPSPSPAATHENVVDKAGDVVTDVTNGAANQVNDMANTTRNVANDMTR